MAKPQKHTIPLRLTDELRDAVYKLAQIKRLTVSDTIRQLILEAAKANAIKLEVVNVS
jgi:hypothetical protein